MKLLFDQNLSYKLAHRLPKVIWIQLGNCTTTEVEQVIRKDFDAIKAFFEDTEAAFLVLSHHTGI